MTATVGTEHPEALRERGHVVVEGARVGEPRMQEHERLAVAVLLVAGADVTELDIGGHGLKDLATREKSSVAPHARNGSGPDERGRCCFTHDAV